MITEKDREMPAKLQKNTASGKSGYLNRLIYDSHFRLLLIAALSGSWNLLYALYHLALAIWFRSFWFLTMGLYYIAACGLRVSALYLSKEKASERAAIKRNAVLTFAMAGVFIGVICLTIAESHNSIYNTIVAISMALYTFYTIVLAIRNMIGLKKHRTTQTILLRNASMVYALGSMFGLERMMLGTFGDPAGRFALVAEAASGAGFLIITAALGIKLLLLLDAVNERQ